MVRGCLKLSWKVLNVSPFNVRRLLHFRSVFGGLIWSLLCLALVSCQEEIIHKWNDVLHRILQHKGFMKSFMKKEKIRMKTKSDANFLILCVILPDFSWRGLVHKTNWVFYLFMTVHFQCQWTSTSNMFFIRKIT